jgi:hypothetical protein
MSKILEKIIYNSLYAYCVSRELLISENSGFKTNDSTVNKLLAITYNIYISLDSDKDVYHVLFFLMCQKLLIRYGTRD